MPTSNEGMSQDTNPIPPSAASSSSRRPQKRDKSSRRPFIEETKQAAKRIRVTSVRVKNGSVKVKNSIAQVPDDTATVSTSASIDFSQNDAVLDVDSPSVALDSLPSDAFAAEEQVGVESPSKTKRSRMNTTASKLETWLCHRDLYLSELLQQEGLGNAGGATECVKCHSLGGIYRCRDCFSCSALRCKECLLSEHANLPFHRAQVWTGKFFDDVEFQELGLCLQLGHDGLPCPFSKPGPAGFTVFTSRGPVPVNVAYCDCPSPIAPPIQVQLLRVGWFPASTERPLTAFTFDILDLVHKLNLQGKVTLYDCYHTLLHRSDNMAVGKAIYRYPELQHVFRIWRHLKALKRSGRGHDSRGASGTEEGELALECPACPQPGKNLRRGWESVPQELQFLFTLFIAIDANFKLKSKDRGVKDFELDSGHSFYVENSRYTAHVANQGGQQEMNACSSDHNAITRANLSVPGYIVNGVALSICSRHALVRRNGAVDLSKGEKYCSIDYLVLSSLLGIMVSNVLISYDIGCQWSKNFEAQTSSYPEDLKLPAKTIVDVGIPSWHANGHGVSCRNNYSLANIPGVGKTCGEDIETVWANTNILAPSTREMGPAMRHESLNDHWNHWNFRKIIGFRTLFAKRFQSAVMMKHKAHEEFVLFSDTFPMSVQEKWSKMVKDWEVNRLKHQGSTPNPYDDPIIETTVQDVRSELAQEDAADVAKGVILAYPTSKTEFLVKGLELEEQQRKFTMSSPSTTTANLQIRRNSLMQRILQWREVQQAHMPSIQSCFEELTSNDDDIFMFPENLSLCLPSSLPSHLRSLPDISLLGKKEVRLRVAQADESLQKICQCRRTITGLNIFKCFNVSGAGNKANTRMRELVNCYYARIQLAAETYRTAYNAICTLEPNHPSLTRFHILRNEDIRGPGKDADESISSRDYEMSWIWLVRKGESDSGDETYNQAMCAEWCRVKARCDHWKEELLLVEEEMQRVVTYLRWKANWWLLQKSNGIGGIKYSSKRLATRCIEKWYPLLKKHGVNPAWGEDATETKMTSNRENEEEEKFVDEMELEDGQNLWLEDLDDWE